MPRPIIHNLRVAGLAQETTETAIVLVQIDHAEITAELGGPLRISSDDTKTITEDPYVVGTVSNGVTWYFMLVEFIFPDDRRDAPPSTQIAFDNIEQNMAQLIRAVRTPASVTMFLTTADDPDTIQECYRGLSAVRATYDASRITIDISRENFTKEPWPSRRMTRRVLPGLFA